MDHQPLEPHEKLTARKHLRDRSCLLRCSLLLKARLQNWHLYFFSGTTEAFRFGVGAEEASVGLVAVAAVGMLKCSELVVRSGLVSAKKSRRSRDEVDDGLNGFQRIDSRSSLGVGEKGVGAKGNSTTRTGQLSLVLA